MASKRFQIVSVFLAVIGLVIGFWPLCLIALITFSLSGAWVLGIALGLFLDLLWGSPIGVFSVMVLPCTFLSCALLLGRHILMQHVRTSVPDHL